MPVRYIFSSMPVFRIAAEEKEELGECGTPAPTRPLHFEKRRLVSDVGVDVNAPKQEDQPL
jgi:hypothetical protein